MPNFGSPRSRFGLPADHTRGAGECSSIPSMRLYSQNWKPAGSPPARGGSAHCSGVTLINRLRQTGRSHAFLADTSADAYEKVVDRLLASPGGERWARHWLDVAGLPTQWLRRGGFLACTPGTIRITSSAHSTRTSVGSFCQEQLAGDELAGARHGDPDAGIRSPKRRNCSRRRAFFAMRRTARPTKCGSDLARNRVVAETLKIVSSSLLGLTVSCAQCLIIADDLARGLLSAACGLRAGTRLGNGAPAAVTLHTGAARRATPLNMARDRTSRRMHSMRRIRTRFRQALAELPEELRGHSRNARNRRTNEHRNSSSFSDHPASTSMRDRSICLTWRRTKSEGIAHRSHRAPGTQAAGALRAHGSGRTGARHFYSIAETTISRAEKSNQESCRSSLASRRHSCEGRPADDRTPPRLCPASHRCQTPARRSVLVMVSGCCASRPRQHSAISAPSANRPRIPNCSLARSEFWLAAGGSSPAETTGDVCRLPAVLSQRCRLSPSEQHALFTCSASTETLATPARRIRKLDGGVRRPTPVAPHDRADRRR